MNPHLPPLRKPTDRHFDQQAEEVTSRPDSPELTIDPTAARIVTANRPGSGWLGMACPPDGLCVDAAMPAIATLRALCASRHLGSRFQAQLTFWTATGVKLELCDVMIIPGSTGVPLALVAMPARALPAAPTPEVDADRNTGDTDQPSGLSIATTDDLATLEKIARRIREGHAMRASPPTDAAPPPAAGGQPSTADTSAPSPVGQDADEPARDVELPIGTAAELHTVPDRSAQLARLAHELKTPISAIAAAAEIMRDERLGPIDNPRYKSYAADIFESARHALYVINNLLDNEQVEPALGGVAAALPMVFVELDLNGIVESCVSSMRPLAEQAGLELTASPEPGLPNVIADATAVRQIALNLITNSVKFTPRGGRIAVSTSHRADGQVVVVVEDNGRGMSADEIARLGGAASMPFLSDVGPAGATPEAAPEESRPSSPTARRPGGGLGIGLPLVIALARANGANIALSGAPSQGTTAAVVFGNDRVVPK